MNDIGSFIRRAPGLRLRDYSELCWACLLLGRRAPSRNVLHPALSTRFAKFSHKSFLSGANSSDSLVPWGSQHERRTLSRRKGKNKSNARISKGDGLIIAGSPPGYRRQLHAARHLKQGHVGINVPTDPPLPFDYSSAPVRLHPNIREHLRLWQENYGEIHLDDTVVFSDASNSLVSTNQMTRGAQPARNVPGEDDQETQDPGTEIEDLIRRKLLLPGDLVELNPSNSGSEPVVAVFVRDFVFQAQFFTVQGRWLHRRMTAVPFSVSGYVDPKLLEPILPFLPTEEVAEELLDLSQEFDLSIPRSASRALINVLADFHRKSLEVYRKHAVTLDNAYAKLAHNERIKIMSLREIAKQLLGDSDPLPEVLSAIRKALARSGLGVTFDSRSHRSTGVVYIRPTREIEVIDKVRFWIREYQDSKAAAASGRDGVAAETDAVRKARDREGVATLSKFITRAQRLIAYSRTMRDPTLSGCLGPSKVRMPITENDMAIQRVTGETFDEDDAAIISFMLDWTLYQRFRGKPELLALGPAILRAVAQYDGHSLGPHTGFLFLQEIGVLAPYENRSVYDENLMLPSSQISAAVQKLHYAGIMMGTDKTRKIDFNDSMSDIRHDWGPLEVYCIDDDTALEIDDGISVEEVPGKDDEYWIRVHVANPTAFIGPNHLLSKFAAHMTETVYTPERAYSMLPHWSTKQYFSLTANRPVLTFSARLDLQGNILEKDIRAGLIRNVVPVTPQTVSKALKGSENGGRVTVTVGGEVPKLKNKRRTVDVLHESSLRNLRVLQTLTTTRSQLRKDRGGLFFNVIKPEMSVYQSDMGPGLSWTRAYTDQAVFTQGDPIIRMESERFKSPFDVAAQGDVAHGIVQESMLLACEIAATWCDERNIPIIYRGTIQNPNRMSLEQFERDVLRPSYDENGIPPFHVGLKYVQVLGNTVCSPRAYSHSILGLPRYAKVTSPLRRYGDMVTHWQIEAALREESRSGISLTVRPNRDIALPFGEKAIETLLIRLEPREKLIWNIKSAAHRFWLCQMLLRAVHFGEAEFPETFRVLLFKSEGSTSKRPSGMIEEFSFPVDLEDPESLGLGEWRLGDVWEAKVMHLDVYRNLIICAPLRLLVRGAEGKSIQS